MTGFTHRPDRVAAIVERTAREGRQARAAAEARGFELARLELERCVALGLRWSQIRPRLAACASGRSLTAGPGGASLPA